MLFSERVARLEADLAALPSLVVALSGGVDSAALLGAAARALPGRILAATTRSEAVPDEEVADAARLAARLGVAHRVIETRELDDPNYRANRGQRCYFCRVAMYSVLLRLGPHVADGLQVDDAADDRPGLRAATEHGILHPLRDAGLGKADVRRLARAYGLDVHDKPAAPCLASRLPVGLEVTVDRLRRVHRAELAVRSLGFREVRVRCEDAHGRIEVGVPELGRARLWRERLEAAVVEAGFLTAGLDPDGYRRGGASSPAS